MLTEPCDQSQTREILVRFAGAADLPFLLQDGHLPIEVERRKVEWGEVIVAERNGQLVGAMHLEYLWSQCPYIALIRVSAGLRRQGVGQALLWFTESFLRARGHQWLYSSSVVGETEPQAWHRHVGSEECGLIAGINEGGLGELFFRKRL